MKRVKAEFPYDQYWLYIVYHRKENRRMACLVKISDISKRTTISYARYLMAINIKRFLTEDEEVDHIDNDKVNDDISNLQILSRADNKRKQDEYKESHTPKSMTLVCPMCDTEFQIATRNYTYHTKNGRTRFNCSRSCAGKSLTRLSNNG